MPVQIISLGNDLTSRKSPAGPYKPGLQRFNKVTKSVHVFRKNKRYILDRITNLSKSLFQTIKD